MRYLFLLGIVFFIKTLSAQPYQLSLNERKILSTMKIISNAYIDTVYEDRLVEVMIRDVLKKLDPYSRYFNKDELKKFNEPLKGNFEGIGLNFQIFNDTVLVVYAIPGGPARNAGILAGDKIVKVDGEDITLGRRTAVWVQKKMRGEKGSELTLTVFRNGNMDLIDYTVVRDKVPLSSLDAAFLATHNTGYIKINRFTKTTMHDFSNNFNMLENNGMKNLILDIRGNSGGYFNTSIALADEFIPEGKLLVYTEGFHSAPVKFKAEKDGNFEEGKLIILVNEQTASVGEILSGAVQDYDRGLIIGRRTYGKGLIQKAFTLPDSTEIRLTVANYYTPSGRSIQNANNEKVKEVYENIISELGYGDLIDYSSIDVPESMIYYTSNNRKVLGGGGIMPDIYVPMNKNRAPDYFSEISTKNIVSHIALAYMNDNRNYFRDNYKDLANFRKNYTVNDDLLNSIISYAADNGIKTDKKSIKDSEEFIKIEAKAVIARSLWDLGAYYEIISQLDEAYLKAVEVIEDDMIFNDLNIKY